MANNLIKTIATIYGIHRSADVPASVFDYCQDQQINLSYPEFKDICRLVACRSKVMLPTSKDMRHFHQLLQGAN